MTAKNNRACEIRLTRLYDAPVRLVWEAWTDPEQVARWWGPRGFTLTTHARDLRAGGYWNYTMHGPDGTDYPNKTVYFEVEQYRRLVYDHGANDEQPPLFRVTVCFEEVDGQTRMDMTMTLPTPEAAREIAGFIREAGGNATWDRLAEYLEKQGSGKEIFVINRSFAASVEVLFDTWTNPEHLARWLAPVGVRMEIIDGSIREGDTVFYRMSGDQDLEFHGTIQYLQIERPGLLRYIQRFCDANRAGSRHPHVPVWPESMLTRVDFSAEDGDRTRVTVAWEPHDAFSDAELQAFVDLRPGMTQGWTGSFDKLEALLG